jgi:hypothetical protein
MAITTIDSLGDTIPTIIEEARFTEQYKEVLSNLCWRITKGVKRGSTINLPYWGVVTANSLTEGIDMVNPQTMEDTNVRFTPGEVGVQILLTDNTVEDDQEDVIRAAGRILGDAMVSKREQDLAGQLDDATNSMGGANTALTLGMIAAAWADLSGVALANGGPAPKPYAAVHHPFVLLDLVDVFTPTLAGGTTPLTAAGSGIAEDVLRNYQVGRVFGMNVYETANITIDSDKDAKGGVFATGRGGGLVLATAREWDVKPDYDPSLRATELNIVGRYDVGEYLPGWIVELYNDATAPA